MNALPATRPILHLQAHARLVCADRTVSFDDRRAAALLALLAVEHSAWGRHAAAWLWPDAPAAQAERSLAALRADIAAACGFELVCGQELLHLAEGLAPRVGPDDAELDALDFRCSAAGLLEAHAYHDLAEFSRWLAAARQRAQRLARARYFDLSVEFANQGDLEAAILSGQRALALDLRCEDCVRHVMQLHCRAGRPERALDIYARCNALMHERHGIEFSADVHALAAAIREGAHGRRRHDAPGIAWAV